MAHTAKTEKILNLFGKTDDAPSALNPAIKPPEKEVVPATFVKADNGTQFVNISFLLINEQLGGIAPDEGIVTVNGDSITVVFRANEGDMAAICGQCQNDNIPYRIQGTSADYYDCVELVNNLQESGYLTASVQVSTERVDEEDIYYYEIDSLCERSENDQLVQIEWDSENEVICMTVVDA